MARAVRRFDAVIFDAGGVLVLPDPTVLAPLLEFYGASTDPDLHVRAHYAAMAAKSRARSGETEWTVYNDEYVVRVGVPAEDAAMASHTLDRTRNAMIWRWPIPSTQRALRRLAAAGVPMGVVSNASGQIEHVLSRTVCQTGPGAGVEMRCIVDSAVVGVAKPDPAIFDHALPFFAGIERSRIAYVGDSVTMDVESSRAAGLHPVLVDPFDDHADADFERVESVEDLADELT